MTKDARESVAIHADMHCHTTCSDGVLSPEALIAKAESTGLQALSITDHDSVDAHHHLRRNGYNGMLRIIPGIEISCYEHGRDIHVLGYGMDIDDPTLAELSLRFRADRKERARESVEKLRAMKMDISFDEVEEMAAGAPIGRPHIAHVLVRHNYFSNLQAVFDRYLDAGKPAYVARSPYPVSAAVEMLHQAGGVAVIAHPGKTYADPRLFVALLSSGIDGVEVYHPSHWFVTREYYRVLSEQHGLLVSGGSDYHGTREYDERNLGKYGLPVDLLEAIEYRAFRFRYAARQSRQAAAAAAPQAATPPN